MLEQLFHPPNLSNAIPSTTSPAELQPSDRQAKRRKISQHTHVQTSSFKLVPHPLSTDINVGINTFPLFILQRSRLPLYFLDTAASATLRPLNSRFFSGHIPTLEQPFPNSHLLIAKIDNDPIFYAIERVRQGIYSLSRLASWVNVSALQAHATPSNSIQPSAEPHHPPAPDRINNEHSSYWWASARLPISFKSNAPTIKSTSAVSPSANEVDVEEITQAPTADTSSAISNLQCSEQTSLDDIKPTLIQQYLDTLYCSKAPVTYFAKGPLSRARAVAKAAGSSRDLANFLRSLVFTVPTAEEKYKTAIPGIVKDHVLCDQLDTRTSPQSGNQAAKKRKAKKLRPRKNGLFPGEEDFVQSWWADLDCVPPRVDDIANGTSQHSHIARVRFRETMLQLVLSFETLYIESSLDLSQRTEQDVAANVDENRAETQSDQKQAKPKRSRDLAKLIDILIDRSIIWQSLDTTHVSDELKDFYLQLIGPFYGARLPSLVTQVGKKLGLSRGFSPKVPSTIQSSDKASQIAPGTEISRSSATKPHRSLQRVSSETLNSKRANRSSLLRSMTDSMVTKAMLEQDKTPKELAESSTTASDRCSVSRSNSVARDDVGHRSLSRANSISLKEDSSRPLSRSNSVSLASQSLKQREVDLSAIAKFKRSKPKKPDVERELQEAISALKKPNRGLCARRYMDAVEERVSSGRGRSNTSRIGVEVTSTPKRPRKTHEGIAATPQRAKTCISNESYDEIPASTPLVPLSAVRQPSSKAPGSSNSKESSLIASTPAAKCKANPVLETPSRRREQTSRYPSRDSPQAPDPLVLERQVSQTPTKVRLLEESSTKERQVQSQENNVYELLGWDDDVDELA